MPRFFLSSFPVALSASFFAWRRWPLLSAVPRRRPKLRQALRQALLAPCTSRRLFGSVHHKDDPTHFHLGFVICLFHQCKHSRKSRNQRRYDKMDFRGVGICAWECDCRSSYWCGPALGQKLTRWFGTNHGRVNWCFNRWVFELR